MSQKDTSQAGSGQAGAGDASSATGATGTPGASSAPGGEWRAVLTMAIPVVVTTSSRALMDAADFVMISGLDEDAARAAILPAQLLMFTYIVLGMGTVSLVNTFASQALGRGQPRECSAYAWQGLYVAIVVGIVGLAIRPLLPAVIAAIGHDPSVQQAELEYLNVSMLTVGPSVAAAALGWFFIGVHRPWVTSMTVIEANIVNAAASYVLIFGHLGFERMGIAGAAWGTLIGVGYRAVRLTLTLLSPSMNAAYASRSTWRPSGAKLRQLFRRGIPAGLHWTSEVVVWTFFVTVLVGTRFGQVHLIATNTAWQYIRLAFMPAFGVGQALTALVGKSIGAGDPQRAMRLTRVAVTLTFVFMVTVSVVYALFRHELMALFNDDPTVVDIGGSIMMCAAVFQLFDGLGLTYDGALRGAGDTLVPAVFFVFSTWIVLVGVAWWVAQTFPQLGSLGPWLAATCLIALTALFLRWRWNGRAWMKIDVLGDRAAAGV